MRILLSGHACGPNLGSEPGVTWNWAWHLATRHQVWVLAHPQHRQQVEEFLAEHPNPNLNFHWVSLPEKLDPWQPARGERGLKLHYLLWQHALLRAARRLHQLHRFDLAHSVSWTSVSAPPLLWRLPIPFIWGPVGGGMSTPAGFRHYLGAAQYKEWLRILRLELLPFLPPLRRLVQHSALILAANYETLALLKRAGAERARLFPDVGLASAEPEPAPRPHKAQGPVTLLWAGRLEPRKALPLALEALALVKDLPVRLQIAGEGPLRATWENQAAQLGLSDRVEFLGLLPWSEMAQYYRQADLFLFTSLRDTFGSVTLEAMSHALPVITLDHQGVGAFLPATAASKVPVTNAPATIAALAQRIHQLVTEPVRRHRMGQAAWHYAQSQNWPQRVEQMTQWYEQARREFDDSTGQLRPRTTPEQAWRKEEQIV